MIIKPAVGGNLLIQDRAGSAVLSTGASGATLESGVTGGSGLTALGTVTAGNLSNTAIVYPVGHVLQIQSSTKADAFTTTSVPYVNISGTDQNASGSIWCVKITPSATSSKILVNGSILWSFGTQTNTASYGRLMRDSTEIGVGSSIGSNASGAWCMDGKSESYYYNRRESHQYLDSPSSTSELVYKIQIGQVYNGDAYVPTDSTLSLNTNSYGTNGAASTQVMRGISTITVTEIKG